MNDFAFVAILLAFFAIAALFVLACDQIIGADDESIRSSRPEVEQEKVAA